MNDSMNLILGMVQSQIDGINREIDEERKIDNTPVIPADERATTYKIRPIDTAGGTIRYYEKQLNICRHQIRSAADLLLERNGYCLMDGRPRKR